ncbi:Macrolide export ATP-binding/permease protein MacB [Anaerohalosphaera lusitana]|uniref:Macrolide export ATP-binding/permease protein MacB n=1 Tax=Anaerohalosphaera lusitana TaxID=1936003 RepID=A0A1U9NQQ5_9BACT|nr:ABC transporter permease [Anaerohalosphaera lusitana]AQT70263.1 Macrolide export ATP-binding/permease protein MacB [Anaerohalosphaera lusitana]
MNSKLWRNVYLGIENLLLHKLRTLLTMLGVVFGVGSVVAMLSVGEGASSQAMEQIKKVGSNNIILKSVKSQKEESTSSTTRSFMSMYGLTYDDHLRIAETFDTVAQAVPVKIVRKEARLGDRSLELRVVGTAPEWFEMLDRPKVAGRVLTRQDIQNQANVAVLTEYGSRRLLATTNTIGNHVRIGSDFFKVVGIVKSEGGSAGNIQMPDERVDAYIPINIARKYYGDIIQRRTAGSRTRERVELHQIIAKVKEIEHVEQTAAGIKAMLERFHEDKDYQISVPLALLKQARETKRTFNIVLGSIAAISLLVGGIGIMNIMLASVTERTREIGIRRAIGAKRKQIINQFIIETVVLSSIGGLVGIGLGITIPKVITHFSGMPTIITQSSILISFSISIGIGIVFGLYPAVRAANVDPIIALRHE